MQLENGSIFNGPQSDPSICPQRAVNSKLDVKILSCLHFSHTSLFDLPQFLLGEKAKNNIGTLPIASLSSPRYMSPYVLFSLQLISILRFAVLATERAFLKKERKKQKRRELIWDQPLELILTLQILRRRKKKGKRAQLVGLKWAQFRLEPKKFYSVKTRPLVVRLSEKQIGSLNARGHKHRLYSSHGVTDSRTDRCTGKCIDRAVFSLVQRTSHLYYVALLWLYCRYAAYS